jgi:hypothetical protein|tara:strand:+ start:4537 stop:5232 length:696 start_codon:yes stop_codon:yes gene_type:complete
MAISIDNVYQQVLAIANKEQRGYITPQEFNLFARKAQLDIFEITFHDYKMALLKPQTQVKLADDIDMLKEKIAIFKTHGATLSVSTATGTIPSDLHWLENIYSSSSYYEEVDKADWLYITSGGLKIKPSASRPVFYRKGNVTVELNPAPGGDLLLDYVKKPLDPSWTYNVVNDRALLNASASDYQDFQLHASEEGSLVNKILELSGIALENPGLAEVALRNEATNEADKNN